MIIPEFHFTTRTINRGRCKVTQKSWFVKHTKTVITVSTLTILVLIIWGLEKGCEFKNKNIILNAKGVERVIRLREHNPFAVQQIYTDEKFRQKFSEQSFQQKYLIRIDADGFIIPSKKYEDPDFSVIFLGASTTECLFNEENRRFPYLVGELLEKKTGRKLNSYNGGKGGNTSLHSINILLNKVIPMQPDIVVMKHNMNDLVTLLLEKTYWNNNPKRSAIITLKNEFRLKDYIQSKLEKLMPNLLYEIGKLSSGRSKIRGVRDEFRHLRGKNIRVNEDYLIKEFKLNLKTFVEICRIRNITPVLLTQANTLKASPDEFVKEMMATFEKDYGVGYHKFKRLYDLFNQAIREVAERNNVAIIDLDKMIPKERKYIFDLIHYTDLGSEYAAAIISQALLDIIKQKEKSNHL